MTMGHHQHTATIIPFPGRAGSRSGGTDKHAGLASGEIPRQRVEIKPRQAAQPDFMDGWYHQAAIDETTPARKF